MTSRDAAHRERPVTNHADDSAPPRASGPAREYLGAMVQYVCPHELLSALMHFATRVRFSPWKNWQIRWFIWRYGVNMEETLEADVRAYPHFNAFFTRALRDDARPLEGDDETAVSPADGAVSQLGDVESDMLLQAKGHRYSLEALLGGSAARSAPFVNGHYITIYLSPRDYHRVHMPVAGRLREMVHIPGRLFSVNSTTTRLVPRLFARNERLVCIFDSRVGPMAVILVGAMMVAGIETVWSGLVTPPRGRRARVWRYDASESPAVELARGDEMARFNTGSTVVLVLPRGRANWREHLGPGVAVHLGRAIGDLHPPDESFQPPKADTQSASRPPG